MAAYSPLREDPVIDVPDNLDEGYKDSNRGEKQKPPQDVLMGNMKDHVASFVWEQGTQQAQKAYNLYANIDILRPYFNVEPSEVRDRLIHSLIPRLPTGNRSVLVGELYGPSMLVFTLIAILLYGMKTSGHEVKEGTLMGTAFGVCFGYWIGVSAFVYFLAYVCNTHISFLHTLSLLGYGLFSHCIVLLLGIIIHPVHDHTFFYVTAIIFGGLAAVKIVFVLMARTAGRSQRLVVCTAAGSLHFLFLIYLHFAYHKTVQVIDNI